LHVSSRPQLIVRVIAEYLTLRELICRSGVETDCSECGRQAKI
jgi:bacterioferritin-associated ferredoxin